MPNCRNIEFYITNAPPSVAAQRKKEQSVEAARKSYLMSSTVNASCSTCTLILCRCGFLGVFFAHVCNAYPVDSPSEQVVLPHRRAHCVWFFSLTPDSQPRCDPMLLFDWPETVNLKAKEEDVVVGGRAATQGYLTTSSWLNTLKNTCFMQAFPQSYMDIGWGKS